MNEEVIELLKSVDGAQCFTYFYMCLFASLALVCFLLLFDIIVSILLSIARKNYINSLDQRYANKVYEYIRINIFNCWQYLKNGKSRVKK